VRPAALVRVACAVVAVVAVAGCGTGGYTSGGSQGSGKQAFTKACASCHTLADAGARGTIGPNLDDAFAQARSDGMKTSTFVQVVHDQILFPVSSPSTGTPGMPGPGKTLPLCSDVNGGGFCVDSHEEAAADIASYVGSVAGTGATAAPPPGGQATGGKEIFQTAGCANCHTLADAGSTGTVGPNLDQAKPPKSLVVTRVTNGSSAGMPPFKDQLSTQQIQAVADYVSSVAGKKK
jgi:mono/diheme cytochrome c family protein